MHVFGVAAEPGVIEDLKLNSIQFLCKFFSIILFLSLSVRKQSASYPWFIVCSVPGKTKITYSCFVSSAFSFPLIFFFSNKYQTCDYPAKLNQLVAFINKTQAERPCKFMVYFATCACVDYFGRLLLALQALKGCEVLSLHGKITQQVGAGDWVVQKILYYVDGNVLFFEHIPS